MKEKHLQLVLAREGLVVKIKYKNPPAHVCSEGGGCRLAFVVSSLACVGLRWVVTGLRWPS